MSGNKSNTRLSLYYLAGYLSLGGIGMLVAPKIALGLLLATGDYGEVMPRLAGSLMLVLAIVIVQIIRHRVDVLYLSTLGARVFLLGCLIAFYVMSGDPLFLALLGIVGFGFVLTATMYLRERSA